MYQGSTRFFSINDLKTILWMSTLESNLRVWWDSYIPQDSAAFWVPPGLMPELLALETVGFHLFSRILLGCRLLSWADRHHLLPWTWQSMDAGRVTILLDLVYRNVTEECIKHWLFSQTNMASNPSVITALIHACIHSMWIAVHALQLGLTL